jgi:hypothetical protein
MEYLAGFQPLAEPPDVWSTLRCRYGERRFNWTQVVAVAAAVARALAYLHSQKARTAMLPTGRRCVT